MHATAHTLEDDRDPDLDTWLDACRDEAVTYQDDAAYVAACYAAEETR